MVKRSFRFSITPILPVLLGVERLNSSSVSRYDVGISFVGVMCKLHDAGIRCCNRTVLLSVRICALIYCLNEFS